MACKHSPLPHHLYVHVQNSFLGPNMPQGTTRGIWHGVYCRVGQAVLCHVLLESGAHWSGLPLHALSVTEDFSKPLSTLQPWGGMGEAMTAFHLPYLEGLQVVGRETGRGRHTGILIDWSDGFSRYPQEHKPLSLIETSSGQYALLPNNYYTIEDKHFTDAAAEQNRMHYRRGETTYWEGE